MPKPKAPETKTPLNLLLTVRVRERLERLRTTIEADSLAEVVRRSLTLYDALVAATHEDGCKVVLRYQDGREETVLLP